MPKTVTDREFFQLSTAKQIALLDAQCAYHQIPMNPPIPSELITVIIQGPIYTQAHPLAPQGITQQVIKNVKKHMPEAAIILATWKGQPIEQLKNLDITQVLLLDDPQATPFYIKGFKADNPYNNCNRLIYSTQAGLQAVKTQYILKLRSDLLMFHPMVSAFFGAYSTADQQWQVLAQRILAFPIFSLKYEIGKNAKGVIIQHPRPFHISDWAYFGLTKDIKTLFDCPLAPEPQTSRWFDTHQKPVNDIWPERVWRYSPEQYITSHLALRILGIKLAHGSDDNPEILAASERFITNNFIILDQNMWGLWSLKLQHYQDEIAQKFSLKLYDFSNWQRDYQKYCID